jgi:hypothetical protein
MPIAIEAGDGAVIDANQKSLEGLEGLLCEAGKREHCAAEQGGGLEGGRTEPGDTRRQNH